MADINPVPTPDTTTPPPVAAPAPAAIPPGLSGLGQAQASPEYAAMQGAAKQYTTDAASPVVAPPGPHARLFQMIQGLGIGLSAMGTSIGTGGKEGGAAQVIQVQGEQQRQKLEAQQQAQNLKNAKLDQDLKVFTTNQSLIQTSMNLATFQQETAKNAMLLKEEEQGLVKGKQDIDIQGADFQATHGGMTAQQFKEQMAITTPAAAAGSTVSPFFLNQANTELRAATKSGLSDDNPMVQNMKTVLADPKATPAQVYTATQNLQNEQAKQSAATDEAIKQQTAADASPLGDAAAADQNKRTEARYQVLNPGKPLPDAYKVTGAMDPAQVKRVTDSLKDTEGAQGIAATRALTNAMHQETLDALRGPQGIDPNLQGPDYLNAIAVKDPGQADMIKAYGQGRLVLSSAIARTPQGQALTKQILRAYPNYIAAKAEGYQKQYNEFTSGKTGVSINSYKTSLDHVNAAFDNVAQASNIDLNNPASKVHQQLDVDKEFLSTELAKAVANGALTEGEKDGMLSAIDGKILSVATKGKYQNQLTEVVRLLKGKLGGFQSQWNSTAVPGSEPPSNLQDAADATQKLAGAQSGGAAPHVIAIGKDQYVYNGSGDTADLKNYTKK